MAKSARQQRSELEPEPEHSRRYLSDPSAWVTFPVVPVKNPRRREQFGFPAMGVVTVIGALSGAAGSTIRVYDVNLFLLPAAKTVGDMQDALDAGKIHNEYQSLDAMLADGWVVD